MDIRRGLLRASYLFLALCLAGAIAGGLPDPAKVGANIVYWLVFTVIYMILFRALAWVFSGFKRE